MDKQRASEIEQKVRTMCYDMVLDVLDQERQLKGQQSLPLPRAKSSIQTQRSANPLLG